MNNILEAIKKIGLFLFGIVLVIWGYGANSAAAKKEASGLKGTISPLLEKIGNQLKQQQDSLASKEKIEETKKNVVLHKKEPVVKESKSEKIEAEPKTIIEPEKSEESSGTE